MVDVDPERMAQGPDFGDLPLRLARNVNEMTMPRVLECRVGCWWAVFLGFALFQAAPAAAQDLSGCWRGCWDDAKSGHRGPLRASFSVCDEQHYHVVFTGRFFKVIPFRFATTLTVIGHDGDKKLLAGQSSLGLFGTFHYSAEATASDFTAYYSSGRYEGRFLLSR
jgi:hypothetical protein